jgi:hypothetical protein
MQRLLLDLREAQLGDRHVAAPLLGQHPVRVLDRPLAALHRDVHR